MNYLQYLLKAKGRHGTHSPFVYDFVEKALHPQRRYAYPVVVPDVALAHTLYRVLSFLPYTQLYIDPAIASMSWVGAALPEAVYAIPEQVPEDALLIVEAKQAATIIADGRKMPQSLKILVWHPQDKDAQLLNQLLENQLFNCTMFTWNFSVLIAHPDFKRKQRYVLR